MEPTGFEKTCRRVNGLVDVVLAIIKLCHEHKYGTVEIHVHEGAIRRHYVKTCHEASEN